MNRGRFCAGRRSALAWYIFCVFVAIGGTCVEISGGADQVGQLSKIEKFLTWVLSITENAVCLMCFCCVSISFLGILWGWSSLAICHRRFVLTLIPKVRAGMRKQNYAWSLYPNAIWASLLQGSGVKGQEWLPWLVAIRIEDAEVRMDNVLTTTTRQRS